MNIEVITDAAPRGDDAITPPPVAIAGPSGTAVGFGRSRAPLGSGKASQARQLPPLCKACIHPDSMAITHELANGAPVSQVARRFGLSNDGVRRHRAHHVSPEAMAAARRRRLIGDSKQRLEDIREDESTNLLARLTIVRAKINAALSMAEEAGDLRAVALLSAQIHVNATLIAKLLGQLQPDGGTTVNVGVNNHNVAVTGSDLFRLRDLIEHTLRPWPDAQRALLGALAEESHAGVTR